MADIKDVAQAIHSALEEIGVSGELDVKMDGDETALAIGSPSGDDMAIEVKVSDLSHAEHSSKEPQKD